MQKTESGFYYGNAPGSVGQALRLLCEQIPGFGAAALRCLDSESAPSRIIETLCACGIEARLGASGVVLTRKQVCLAAHEGLFTGFDEVWFWREESIERQFLSDIVLTSDAINLAEGLPNSLERAMQALGSFLALGDGCGLNFVTTDRDLAAQIEEGMDV